MPSCRCPPCGYSPCNLITFFTQCQVVDALLVVMRHVTSSPFSLNPGLPLSLHSYVLSRYQQPPPTDAGQQPEDAAQRAAHGARAPAQGLH